MNIEELTDQTSSEHDLPAQEMADQGMGEYLTEGYGYQAPRRGEIRTGVVMEANDQGIVVDIGFKREGLVPMEDLEHLDEESRSALQPGAEVPVFVLRTEDKDGHPVLSIQQARLYEDWVKAEQLMASGELYEGQVAGYNRGGLIVRYGKIRGFVPTSQIVGLPRRLREEQRRERLEAMVGEPIGLKVIEVDRQRRRLIFSQRRALRTWQELQRKRVMSQLTQGETRRGKVTSITNFGAFVDLGGADGLIHVSELSWGRVDNPRQVIKVGDELDVYVLDVDQQRKRIALSLKKLQPDPWTIVDEHYHQGQLVEGHVTRVLDFGAFVELGLGVEGLLHASEMIGTPELPPNEIVHSGEKLLVKIIRIDSKRRRLALSARQVRKSEWERWVAEQQQIQEQAEAEAAAEAAALAAEAATSELAEEVAPVIEVATSELAEEAPPVTEVATSEVAEEAPPVTEVATSEVAEEAPPVTEVATSEVAEEAPPVAEVAPSEVAEEVVSVPEAVEAVP